MANLEFENLESQFEDLFKLSLKPGQRAILSIDSYRVPPISSKNENISVGELYRILNEIMLNTFAHTGIGERYQLPAGIELKKPTQQTLIRDAKIFEKWLIEQTTNMINTSIANRVMSVHLEKEIEQLYNNLTSNSLFVGSLLHNIEGKSISGGRFGTWFEKNYFQAYERGKASDPRADIFDLALEIKTSNVFKETNKLTVGDIQASHFGAYFGDISDKFGNLTKKMLDEDEKIIFGALLATYKTVIKMRNLLLVFIRSVSIQEGRIGFQEIDLFTLIKVRKVYDEIKASLMGEISDIISVDVNSEKTADWKGGEINVYNINYTISFKMPSREDIENQEKKKKPILDLDTFKIKELYERQIDLLSIARTPNQDKFRRALFGLLRYQKLPWMKGK